MKKIVFPIFILFLVAACTNSSQKAKEISFHGETQGTYYMLKYYDAEGKNYQKQIDSILAEFDKSLSAWLPNSIISRINRNENDVKLDSFFKENFMLAQQVARETQGAFDITINPLVEAWGFGLKKGNSPDQHTIDSLRAFTGYEKVWIENDKLVKADPRIELNFNAIAQGYAVDMLGSFLLSKNIENFIIDIGGEVKTKGLKSSGAKWTVGIQKPTQDAQGDIEAQVLLYFTDKALVSSGNYRKYIDQEDTRYSHIIDPISGYPVKHKLLSVSVLADNCALADAYATAFMVMGMEKATAFLKQKPEVEACFIYMDDQGELQTKAVNGLEKRFSE